MSGLGGFQLPVRDSRGTLRSTASVASRSEIAEMQYAQAKADLCAALTDYIKQVSGTSTILQVPGSYYDQVTKCREIWGGKFSDPFVSDIMDMVVEACVDFGSENLLKTKDPDSPQQRVLDDYCANVNSDMPTVTKGLDAVGHGFHRQRFLCGGVVGAWSPLDTMKTRDGVEYQAPRKVAMYARDVFKPLGSREGEFGGMKLTYRDDLQEHDENSTANQPLSKVSLEGFLDDGRYQVLDRGRDEANEHFPKPYLASHGLIGVCERLRAHQAGDYQTNKRIIRALLLVTRGSDAWVELTDEIPELRQFEYLKDALVDSDGNYVNVFAGDYTLDAKYVIPDLQGLLSSDKYVQDNLERLAGLGIIRIEGAGQRISYMYNPKPLLMEMFSSMQAYRRFVEGIIFKLIVDANPRIFQDAPLPNFRHRIPTLFLEQFEKEHIATMFERGGSWGTYGEQIIGFGFDMGSEVRRREREKAEGYDEILEPRVLFTQTVRDNAGGKEKELKPINQASSDLEAAKKVNLVKSYRDVREQVKEAAKSEMRQEEKKRRIWSIVMASFAGMAFLLQKQITDYYCDQFDGTAEHLSQFEPYIAGQAKSLEAFGQDLLEGRNGMTGLYLLATAPAADVDGIVKKAFDTHLHRLTLYEREPFRVAKLAAQAAKAMSEGMKYAVRHSAFTATTCQECIDSHGSIVSIAEIVAGTWEHPHGECSLTFHSTMAAAQQEKEEMLSIDEINDLVATLDEMEDALIGA